jgi:hypothetical protein
VTRPEGKRRLADRLSEGAPELAAFRAVVHEVDNLRSLIVPLAKETRRKYEFWLRTYLAWRAENKFQPSLAGMTDEVLAEFVAALAVREKPYDPRSIKQALSAMRHWAERTAVDPQPSFRAAFNLLAEYQSVLEAEELIVPRKRRTRRPTVEE